nr:DUF2399 domain-containing protein [Streptomyces flavochromogenes]
MATDLSVPPQARSSRFPPSRPGWSALPPRPPARAWGRTALPRRLRLGRAPYCIRTVASRRPWRYTAADYRAAALARPDGPPLAGQRAVAFWDPDLQQALLELAVRVEEETGLDVLLSDLA